jgi:gluconate 2-dehydrogenase
MKKSAILVNIARGGVVDEHALIAALESGAIYGAGLDVFEQEPLPLDSPLLKLDNVVLAPHIGSATQQTRDAMATYAAETLISFLRDGKGRNIINPEAQTSAAG